MLHVSISFQASRQSSQVSYQADSLPFTKVTLAFKDLDYTVTLKNGENVSLCQTTYTYITKTIPEVLYTSPGLVCWQMCVGLCFRFNCSRVWPGLRILGLWLLSWEGNKTIIIPRLYPKQWGHLELTHLFECWISLFDVWLIDILIALELAKQPWWIASLSARIKESLRVPSLSTVSPSIPRLISVWW